MTVVPTHCIYRLARRNWRWIVEACERDGIDPLLAFHRYSSLRPGTPDHHFYYGCLCGMADILDIDAEELLCAAGVPEFAAERETQ